MSDDLVDLLACPICHGVLRYDTNVVRSDCGAEFEIRDDVPVLVSTLTAHARRQAEWFDLEDDREWEIERPRGAPPLYRWLLFEKFRRSVEGLDLAGRTALCVCAGSGMDAEFMARGGARVIAVDISLGAVRRAIERSSRHELDLIAVVADATRLPLRDASVDIVYVHDGLHHLDEPREGLAEMIRVARYAVCVAEPAQAALSRMGVRIGVAQEVEEAGNRVARVDARALVGELEHADFRVVRNDRYAMYYRHHPGRLVRVLSHRPASDIAKLAFRLMNVAIGRWGNKLTIVAVRR